MSIASELTRLAGLRDTIRSKLLNLEVITNSSAKLSDCSSVISDINESTLTVPSTVVITPSMTVNPATGVVSVSGNNSDTVVLDKGYSKGLSKDIAPGVSGSLELETQDIQTITPGTANKTIAAGRWLAGDQIIKGDSNLVADNIKSGASIFGVSGAYKGCKTKIVSNAQIVTTYYTSKVYDDEEVINYYRWYVPIDISGINPRYAFFVSNNTNSKTPDGHFVLNGTYVIYGFTQAIKYSNSADSTYTGKTLTMQGTNLLLPIGSTSTSYTGTSYAYTFTVYLLGQ